MLLLLPLAFNQATASHQIDSTRLPSPAPSSSTVSCRSGARALSYSCSHSCGSSGIRDNAGECTQL